MKNRRGEAVFITNGRTGKRLAVDPNDSRHLLYGSRKDGLLQSRDGGQTWQQRTDFSLAGQSPDGMSISFVLSDQRPNSRTVYALATLPKDSKVPNGLLSGLYRSDDSGTTWKFIEGAPTGIGELDAQGTLYIAGKTVQRLKDGKWQNITPPQRSGFSGLAISPGDANLIAVAGEYCGGGNSLFRSVDGGQTWTEYSDNDFERGQKTTIAELQPWEGGNNGAHAYACVSSLTFDRADPKKLLMGPTLKSCG